MEQKFYYSRELEKVGVNYIGKVAQSAKLEKSYRNGVMTYCIYLAPATMAGRTKKDSRINVCPKSQHCKAFCLNGSGQNRRDELAHGTKKSLINISRIKKTKLFYNDRDTFMRLVIHEMRRWQQKAQEKEMGFSVRLNGTSDLSPVLFKDPDTGLNLLELFPNVQFYDYSKIINRFKLVEKYPNYDLTFSYDGYNDEECKKVLESGGRVAVVFFDEKLPKYFNGYPVVDGNKWDMRYLDPKGCVVGLHYHRTASDYYIDEKDGKRKFRVPDTPFVVKINDPRIEWY